MQVELRTDPLKVVRNMNKVPGVLFGKHTNPISIQVDEKELFFALKEFGLTKTFKIKVGKTTHTVYIKDVQREILNPHQYQNVKLLKVDKGDKIVAHVPLNIIGKEQVEKPNVLLHIISDSIEVEFDVGKGVSHIDLDISQMKVGDSVYIKDIDIPKGLKVLEDMEKVLIYVTRFKKTEVVEEKIEEEYDPSKVEVIKQKNE